MEHTTVNGYYLKYKLGEGGMAEVWYAENALQKPAAVKILQQRFCNMEELVSRFANEAQIMVQLSHPHIRNIYDYATVNDCPCMVMEYVEGADLSQRLKKGERFSNDQLITWWNDLVEALQYTHRKNIIHRDIKPSNLFVTEAGQIKVLDFGIAKVRDNITVTQTGSRMGTLTYMSPEQVYDVKHLSYKTDAYSLAVTFYHLVTGAAPYDGTKISDFEIQESIVRKEINTSALPEPWRSLLPRYLHKQPELRSELQKIQSDSDASRADDTLLHKAPTGKQPALPAYTRPVSHNNWRYVLLSVCIIAALVAGILHKDALTAFIKNNRATQNNKPAATPEKAATRKPPIAQEISVAPITDTIAADKTTDETQQIVTTTIDATVKENIVKQLIADYYRSRSDCKAMYRFFTDPVLQYYNKSNISVDNIIKECEQYHSKWQFIEADINSDSYVFTHQQDGTTYVDFSMVYKIKKQEADDWVSFQITVGMVVDADNRIARIVERSIEKL